MNRSSARPSSASFVTSPSTSRLSVCRDSSRVLGPIRAFFSTVVCTTSSVGPTCAIETGPAAGTAEVRARIGRFRAGSRTDRLAEDRSRRHGALPPGNAASNVISRGITRPSDVPMT